MIALLVWLVLSVPAAVLVGAFLRVGEGPR